VQLYSTASGSYVINKKPHRGAEIQGNYKRRNMEVLKYKIATYKYTEIKDRVSLPKFQRGFVWPKKKQDAFVTTLKKGLPIGMFLLHKIDGSDKFSIIDGRQRMTTLISFENKAFEYFNLDDISDEEAYQFFDKDPEAANIFHRINEAGKTEYIKKYKDVIYKCVYRKKINDSDSIKFDLVDELASAFSFIADKKYIREHVALYVNELISFYDLSRISVPVIEFTGTLDEVVETFVNLNTKGTKLSKYDVFAAEWLEFQKTISDSEIISEVYNKYSEAAEKGIEIEGFDSENIKTTETINIFEYAYAISKILGKKCKLLVSISENADDIDTLAFTILAGVFSIKNKDMRQLGEKVYDSNIDLVHLKSIIVESTRKIEDILQKYLAAPTKDRTRFGVLSELQISSYIITWYKLNYLIQDGKINRTNFNKNKIKGFETYLHKHMLYDVLRGFWSGSGDSKLDELNENIDNSRYFDDISSDNFRTALDEWFEERKNKGTVSKEVKFVLNYLFVKVYQPQDGGAYDLDHIVPQANLSKLNLSDIDINNPANLVYISRFDNRKKREDTYYQLVTRNKTSIEINQSELDRYLYPRREEIRFVESQEDFTKQA
jgi:uncharacterized protein with ParB-like and HNH nuclease domain